MAAEPEAENSIAVELMSIVSQYVYKRTVQYISPRDAVSQEQFDNKEISNSHWIDRRRSYSGRVRNSEFLFELFGSFSSETGPSVREDMIKRIELERPLYDRVGSVVLSMRGCNIEEWMEDMSDHNHYPDELMLYALSRTYNRHSLVVCRERNWSTIESPSPMSERELLTNTHVHLVYLGNSVFGELKPKPYVQDLNDPVTEIQLTEAMNKVRGKGRPRSKPLDLCVRQPTAKSTTPPHSPTYARYSDSSLLHVANIGLQHIKVPDYENGVQPLNLVKTDLKDVNNDGFNMSQASSSTRASPPMTEIDTTENYDNSDEEKGIDTVVAKGSNGNDSNISNSASKSVKGSNADSATENLTCGNSPDSQKMTPTMITGASEEDDDKPNEPSPKKTVTQINESWIKSAQTRKYFVPLKKLTKSDIYSMNICTTNRDATDPHPSLVRVTDGGNGNGNGNDILDTDPTRRYSLREKKIVPLVRHSNKPLRGNRTVVNYSSLLKDSETEPPQSKTWKTQTISS